ncbi:MAG: DUF1905 domain-containing protein [Catenulispora sp.]|nr:DUF1905 domain-containing protein [Catenulispora sp.]
MYVRLFLEFCDRRGEGEEELSALWEKGSARRPAVVATLNGDYTYRTTIASMRGAFMFPISAATRKETGIAGGDPITVRLALDVAPRTVEVPEDLAAVLAATPAARDFFEGLSYTNRKWHVEQVTGAKTPETRTRRIEKSVALLAAGTAR